MVICSNFGLTNRNRKRDTDNTHFVKLRLALCTLGAWRIACQLSGCRITKSFRPSSMCMDVLYAEFMCSVKNSGAYISIPGDSALACIPQNSLCHLKVALLIKALCAHRLWAKSPGRLGLYFFKWVYVYTDSYSIWIINLIVHRLAGAALPYSEDLYYVYFHKDSFCFKFYSYVVGF